MKWKLTFWGTHTSQDWDKEIEADSWYQNDQGWILFTREENPHPQIVAAVRADHLRLIELVDG